MTAQASGATSSSLSIVAQKHPVAVLTTTQQRRVECLALVKALWPSIFYEQALEVARWLMSGDAQVKP